MASRIVSSSSEPLRMTARAWTGGMRRSPARSGSASATSGWTHFQVRAASRSAGVPPTSDAPLRSRPMQIAASVAASWWASGGVSLIVSGVRCTVSLASVSRQDWSSRSQTPWASSWIMIRADQRPEEERDRRFGCRRSHETFNPVPPPGPFGRINRNQGHRVGLGLIIVIGRGVIGDAPAEAAR